MMNKFLFQKAVFIVLLITIGIYANAQNRLAWVRGMGGTLGDIGNGVAVDTLKNVYTVGNFNTTVDFDPGVGVTNLTSAGGVDVFITKMDSSGNLIWARRIGGTGAEEGNAITVDAGGNVYVTGAFSGKVDFNPSTVIEDTFFITAYPTFKDAFVLKLDSGGNFMWVKVMGGKQGDLGLGIALDAGGNVYTTGSYTGKGIFNTTPASTDTFFLTSAGMTDIFVNKLDGNGNFAWTRSLGGTGADVGTGITISPTKGIFVTGSFTGTADFDPGPINNELIATGSTDIFVCKLDGNGGGDLLWAKRMGGTGASAATAIALDIFGNIFTTGTFAATTDFDPGGLTANLVSAGDKDIFISKLDASGNYVWAKRMGSTTVDAGNGIAVDLSGNVYTTGSFTGIVDFDPGPLTYNFTTKYSGSVYSREVFISKLSPTGEFIWAIQNGGKTSAGSGGGNGIAVGTFNREVYITGSFIDTLNFNSRVDTITLASAKSSAAPTAPSSTDIFVYKMLQPSCRTYATLSAAACDNYTYNGKTYTASGTYTDVLTNIAGCDSIVVLTLTIQRNSYNFSQTACDSFILNGQKYTTSGVYTQTHTNVAGCDSVITMNLTVKYSSQTNLADTACSSYILNGQTYTTTGIYKQTFTNAVGCDSIVSLDLVIDTPTSEKLVITACDSFTLNGQTYAITAVYTQALTNVAGCDSTLIIDVTIVPSPTASVIKAGTTLTAGTADAYQWIDCDKGNAPISGATQKTLVPSANGNYAVVVTTSGTCSDTSDCINVTGVAGIEEVSNKNNLYAYPNPADGIVNIRSDEEIANATIRVMDMAGRVLIKSDSVTCYAFTVNLSPYPNGIYLLEINEINKVQRIRLVKE